MYRATFNNYIKATWKYVKVVNKNLEIYGAFRNKTNFHQFFLRTDDPVLTGESIRPLNGFQILGIEPVNGRL